MQKMNLSISNRQALELVTFLKKENTFPLISRQIDNNFKEMEVSELLELQDMCPSTFTIEFLIECVKCGFDFESIAVKNKTPPTKHTTKCPSCGKKYIYNFKK